MKIEPNYSHEVARRGRERFVGKCFRHYKKGALYVVVDVAVFEGSLVVLVIYEDCEDRGKRWVRPRDDFFAIVGFDEMEWKPIYRFMLVEGE